MFAVGVDVSNGRSTVAVLQSKSKVILKPFEVPHTQEALGRLVDKLNSLDGENRVIMEHTVRYVDAYSKHIDCLLLLICNGNPTLPIADSICLLTRDHLNRFSTCIKRTLSMEGWLVNFQASDELLEHSTRPLPSHCTA